MAIGSYVLCIGYSILPALEVHLLQTKLHALLSGAGLSTLLDLNKATLPPPHYCSVPTSASKSSIRRFVITEKAPTRAFSWLKAATTAFTFKTLC